MGFNCGIVGLPNVGKSTIFNALTSGKAEAANYPFCTIEPNTGIVAVPDERMQVLANIAGSERIIPNTIEFVDIAGLVKGASKGEGLGNQFLGHIRAVDAIIQVVRCFDDENIVHVSGSVGPSRDIETIELELILSDLSSVEKRAERVQKLAKGGDKDATAELNLLKVAKEVLDQGVMLNRASKKLGIEELDFSSLGLLTSKPMLYLANVSEEFIKDNPANSTNKYLQELSALAKENGTEIVVLSGAVESEIAQLDAEDRKVFLNDLGVTESGLDRLAQSAYKLLNLLTFFTVGPKETHAWNCVVGSTAPQSAGKIHTDFEKGFIRAEVIKFADFIQYGSESAVKEAGKLGVEGKEYLVQDGDIMHFRFNV